MDCAFGWGLGFMCTCVCFSFCVCRVSFGACVFLCTAFGLGRGHRPPPRSSPHPGKAKDWAKTLEWRVRRGPKSLTPAPSRPTLRVPDQGETIVFPEGAPTPSYNPSRVVWLQRPGQNSQSPPPLAGYPGPAAVLLPTLAAVGPSLAPGQCAPDLRDFRNVRPRAGSRPRSRWQTPSERTESMPPAALEILGKALGLRGV